MAMISNKKRNDDGMRCVITEKHNGRKKGTADVKEQTIIVINAEKLEWGENTSTKCGEEYYQQRARPYK